MRGRKERRAWWRRPGWLLLAGSMALNLWIGCSDPAVQAPVANAPPPPTENAAKPMETPAQSVTDAVSDTPAAPRQGLAEEEIQPTPPSERNPLREAGVESPDSQSIAGAAKVESPHTNDTPAKSSGYGVTAKQEEPPVDLFADWPAPAALLVLSGDQRGYIEPCGCAGLENQKGGLKRRHTFVKQMRERGWPLALFDLGEQVRRFGIQSEIKYRTAIQSLEKIGYQVVGFGPDDLQLPAEQLLLLDLPAGASLFVSANVHNAFAPEMIVPFKIVKVGEKRIAVTTVLGPTFQDRIRNEGIEIRPAAEALAEVTPKMRAEADYLVLMANSTLEEAVALGKQFPDFNLVVTASGGDEPPLDSRVIEGTEKTYLVDLGAKGMFLAAIGLYDDPETPLRYMPVPLDKRFADSPEMQKLFEAYQRNLKAIGLKGLDLNIRPHARGAEFVGSESCADCHTKAFEIWKHTPHAHATDTLLHLNPPRQFDAECLSCHVTGWELNPGTYVPYLSGYLDEASSKHLFGNGCENCHGPGSAHVKAESGEVDADENTLLALR